jgi:hypothetical protein
MTKGEFSRAVATLCVVLCAVMLAGCAKKPDRGTVTGSVTLDGQPLPSGVIHFVPADGKTATADSMITDGKFSASVPPGDKKVSISAPKVTGKKRMFDKPDSPEVDVVQELLPAKYNVQTQLTLTVNAGSQEKDFPLSSGK